MNSHNLIIIGSGPAGYTAAIYAARANLNPVLFEGYAKGGQLMLTSDVENYPGFPEGVLGPDLMERFRKQAEKFGTRLIQKNITKVDFLKKPFTVWADEEQHLAKAIIISTGASANWLNLPGEEKFFGKGYSSCATCDGAFFKGEKLVVVGGGDSAMEEAHFLTRFASSVAILHRRDKFRASKIMQDRVLKNPKISVLWDSAVEKILGEDLVKGVQIKNFKTNEIKTVECAGLFVAIGHSPNTSFLKGQIELDEKGYVLLKNRPKTHTNIAGVFAAGDVQDIIYRQAITAAGSGCQAAMDAERYLEEIGH